MMETRTQKIMALLKKNEDAATESNFSNGTLIQPTPELTDENLDFDEHAVTFVVKEDGLLYIPLEETIVVGSNKSPARSIITTDETFNFVNTDNIDNYSDVPTTDGDSIPNSAPYLEPGNNNSDRGDTNENQLSRTQVADDIIHSDASLISDPEYVPSPVLDSQTESSSNDQNKSDGNVEEELNSQNNNVSVTEQYGDMSEGRKRKHRADKSEWKKNRNQKLRMEGKEYLGYTKPKGEVMKQNQIREARALKPTCTSRSCRKSKKRMCDKFTEEERRSIFTRFWSQLNWDQRKIYVVNHVNRVTTKRKTTSCKSRRGETLNYTLTLNQNKYAVCRTMFLNTLGLGSFTVQSWTKKADHGMHTSKDCDNLTRVKNSPYAEDLNNLKEFLQQLPKLPSHYNRANSSKLYLEPIFKSLKQLYDLYSKECKNGGKRFLSSKTFYNYFNESNLALYQPKKDQCDICVSHRVGNLSDDKYAEHVKKKDRARTEKETDKNLAQNKKCIVLTMDLQAVKVCPVVQASSVFFKTKLCCHNFTIYDVDSHHCVCYWFTECDSELVASAFTSCIVDYLERYCAQKELPVIIYSDGCTYQNRNNILSNALLNYSIKNKIPIYQKYLERGHTQMECDSVHSCIERKLKNRDINLPSDYISASKEARTKPFPYEVIKLSFNFFKDYSKTSFLRYSTIRPGRRPNEPTVTDIRALRYNPEGSIDYKLHFDHEWRQLPSRPKQLPEEFANYPPLNKSKIPIKKSKFNHLQELKNVLPDDCHGFYDTLPCKDC